MQSFITRLLECKETETLEEVSRLQLFGSGFLLAQSVHSLWAAPSDKQSLSPSGEAAGDSSGAPQSALAEEKATFTLCPRTARPLSPGSACGAPGQRPSPSPAPGAPARHRSGLGAAPLPASPVRLEMTLLLQRIANETNAPLRNIISIILQRLPLRDSRTAATKVLPQQGAEGTTQLDTALYPAQK